MSDILNEEEVGHFPHVSQSKYERMHEQYNSFLEEEEHWQNVRGISIKTACCFHEIKEGRNSIFCEPMAGFGSLEESPPQCFAGAYQERGREEEDGEKDERGRM